MLFVLILALFGNSSASDVPDVFEMPEIPKVDAQQVAECREIFDNYEYQIFSFSRTAENYIRTQKYSEVELFFDKKFVTAPSYLCEKVLINYLPYLSKADVQKIITLNEKINSMFTSQMVVIRNGVSTQVTYHMSPATTLNILIDQMIIDFEDVEEMDLDFSARALISELNEIVDVYSFGVNKALAFKTLLILNPERLQLFSDQIIMMSPSLQISDCLFSHRQKGLSMVQIAPICKMEVDNSPTPIWWAEDVMDLDAINERGE